MPLYPMKDNYDTFYLTGSFVETVKWWTANRIEMPPEELADCYLKLI